LDKLSTIRQPPLPYKGRRSRTLLLLLAIGLFIPGAFVVWRVGIYWRVCSRLKAFHQAGYPASMAELQQIYYSPVPDTENNALYFIAALKNLQSTNGFKSSVPLWIGPSGYELADDSALLSPEGSKTARRFLSQNAEVLNNLRKIPPGETARYQLDFSNRLANARFHLIKAQDGVRLLLLAAMSSGGTSNTDLAATDLNAAMRLTQSLGDEPMVMSQMTRIKCDLMIIPCLERILARNRLAESQLFSLANSFQHLEFTNAMERAMAGDRCDGIYLFTSPAFFHANSNRHALYVIMKLTGYMDSDFNHYLKLMADEVAVARMPLPQRLDAAKNLDQRVDDGVSKLHLMTSMMIPHFYRAHVAQAEDVARIDIARTVLAIERYRLSNKDHLPASLQELVPAYLGAVPADPFDGRPIRYNRLPKGYLIYSVGEDGVDNGGAEWNEETKTGDITFTVER
jgi:hypothetical protein